MKHSDHYWNFLNALRESGITNMFGAGPYLRKAYPEIDKREASKIVTSWMQHFGEEFVTILKYDDFEVYKSLRDGKYYHLEDGVANEVELNLAVYIRDDVEDEDLIGAYESDVCGEGEGDNCDKYYYFSRKSVIECLRPDLKLVRAI